MGILSFPAHPSGSITYLAGTILGDGEEGPSSFVQKSIPPSDGAALDLPFAPSTLRLTRRFIDQTWWPKATSNPLPKTEIEFWPATPVGVPHKEAAEPRMQLIFPFPQQQQSFPKQ